MSEHDSTLIGDVLFYEQMIMVVVRISCHVKYVPPSLFIMLPRPHYPPPHPRSPPIIPLNLEEPLLK